MPGSPRRRHTWHGRRGRSTSTGRPTASRSSGRTAGWAGFCWRASPPPAWAGEARLADLAEADPSARTPAELAAFIEANTVVATAPLVPEIRLQLATEVTPLWQASERLLREAHLPQIGRAHVRTPVNT